MFISMQGNWTINVKAKQAVFPQRFVVSGAASGNGVHNATVGMAPVPVTGNLWTIAIQNNPGAGFQQSDTRLKFPVLQGGFYKFDIESNDAGADQDFNDLILTCSTPATLTDYLIYGNVSTYSGRCFYNPCYRGWLVIETAAALQAALQNPLLSDAIKRYYPHRMPPVIVNPNPPDPGPFLPIMLSLDGSDQPVGKVANIFRRTQREITAGTDKKAAKDVNAEAPAEMTFERTVTTASSRQLRSLDYDTIALSKFADLGYLWCTTSPASYLTLNFQEYDRSPSELAGGPYTGTGIRDFLGSIITDMNGNYIFRFTQSLSELINEVFNDVAAGENLFVQYRPDLIVSVPNISPPPASLYESAPYYNIPNLYRLDLCLPKSQVPGTSLCFNGNLIGSLGNVFVGGNQNTAGSIANAALDRNGYNNHLRADGRVTVHNSQAGFAVDCACWAGLIDLKGCMYNVQRSQSDPIIKRYTIRYSQDGVNWQFVTQSYLHPLFSKRNIPNYNGDLVGPFPATLNVDGGGPVPNTPSYKNIQAEAFFDGIDWEFSNLDRYMQLSSGLYQGALPGRVFFKVEGYDAGGNLVPGAKDLIGLFIDNDPLGFSLDNVWFDDDGVNIIKAECNLYRMTEAVLNTPLKIIFKANDKWGFLDHYDLGISKCGAGFAVVESIPGISSGSNPGNTDGMIFPDPTGCPGYTGTADISKFGNLNSNQITYSPAPVPTKKWLESTESYTVYYLGLTASKRETNGYNSGLSGTYVNSASFAVERIS
jgi:hypothetical protein